MDLDKLEAYAKHGDMGPYSAQFVELITLIRKQEAALQAATTQEVRVVASSSAPSLATVDTPEFKEYVYAWAGKYHSALPIVREGWHERWVALIAHIDAHVAAQVAAKDAEIKTLKAALDAQGELTDRYQEIALSAQEAAPGVAARPDRINLKHGAYLKREAKTTGENGWLLYGEQGLVRALNVHECELVDCAIGAASQPSPAPVAMTDDLTAIIKFLLGEAQLDGTWFGDRAVEEPKYWWRKNLRAILAAQQEAV